jgi:hypothetical protein
MKKQIALAIVLSTIHLSFALGQTPEKTTNRNHPFAKQLEALYVKYLETAGRGDVSATLQIMTSEYAQMAARITPELLKGMSADDLDPRESQFVGLDVSKKEDTARAVYQQLGLERKVWAAIIFKNEGGEWKIAKILSRGKTGPGTENGLQELLKDTNSFLQEQ